MNEKKINAVVLNGKAVEIDEMTTQRIQREMKRQELRDKVSKVIKEIHKAGFKVCVYPENVELREKAMFGDVIYLPLDD